jgi:hypothetical protein
MRRLARRLFTLCSAVPTRGGMLTILNCALWLVFVCVVRFVPEPWSIPATVLPWVLAPPGVGCLAVLPQLGGGPVTLGGVISAATATAVNAFAWGYGLSWIVSRLRERRERALTLSPGLHGA